MIKNVKVEITQKQAEQIFYDMAQTKFWLAGQGHYTLNSAECVEFIMILFNSDSATERRKELEKLYQSGLERNNLSSGIICG